ncbi:MAG: hypothetical protein ABJL99_24885 [Aliishimia sp.]
MRLIKQHGGFVAALGAVALLGVWLWLFGGAAQIASWAASEQREVQGALANALRAVRAGEVWAWASLLGLCFAYGFFHAAGPGHGKLVMSGYALGEDVLRLRLIALTLAGSVGQAVTAILLVYLGTLVFGLGRVDMTDLADGSLAAFSAGAIVLVGVWLILRGIRRFSGAKDAQACSCCGHVHGPSVEQVAHAQNWRLGLGVVLAVAVRPCTGALFVLILTYGMGIPFAGILGALVMGLGTAILTLCVALGAWHMRGGLLQRLEGSSGVRAMAVIECVAGSAVAVIATQMMLRSL